MRPQAIGSNPLSGSIICPSIRPSVRPPVCLSVHPSVCLSVHPFIRPSISSSVRSSVRSSAGLLWFYFCLSGRPWAFLESNKCIVTLDPTLEMNTNTFTVWRYSVVVHLSPYSGRTPVGSSKYYMHVYLSVSLSIQLSVSLFGNHSCGPLNLN